MGCRCGRETAGCSSRSRITSPRSARDSPSGLSSASSATPAGGSSARPWLGRASRSRFPPTRRCGRPRRAAGADRPAARPRSSLRDLLADGPVRQKEVKDDGRGAGCRGRPSGEPRTGSASGREKAGWTAGGCGPRRRCSSAPKVLIPRGEHLGENEHLTGPPAPDAEPTNGQALATPGRASTSRRLRRAPALGPPGRPSDDLDWPTGAR